jgi:inner membrane transporter RhtA
VTGPGRRHDGTLGAACVVAAAISIQASAAIGIRAFDVIGAASTSGFRFLLGAIVATAIVRPALRGRGRHEWAGIWTFGIAVAAMNLCFFQAVARLPLGTAVSIEFLGPFAVAVVKGRGARHYGSAAIGLVGVVLLARPGGGITLAGTLFALAAAVGWGIYTLASQRLGSVTEGYGGLALGLAVAAVLTLPFSLRAVPSLTVPLLGRLLAMAVLGVVVGFALELSALRRLPASRVAVLFSVEPAIAFAIGWLFLGQHVVPATVIGGCLIAAAGIGVTLNVANDAVVIPPA